MHRFLLALALVAAPGSALFPVPYQYTTPTQTDALPLAKNINVTLDPWSSPGAAADPLLLEILGRYTLPAA